MGDDLKFFSRDRMEPGVTVEDEGTEPEPTVTDPPAQPDAPRPPAIVTETRVPNVLMRGAPDEFCTVIVVQGDDPLVVAGHLAVLREQLFKEETDGTQGR